MRTNGPVLRLMKDVPGIPIHAIFGRSHAEANPARDHRPALRAADLIFGRDVDSGHEFLVYGRDALDGRTREFGIVVVELDMETTELETLLALVTCLRGRHDYLSWGEAPAGERLTAEEMAAWGERPANGGGR